MADYASMTDEQLIQEYNKPQGSSSGFNPEPLDKPVFQPSPATLKERALLGIPRTAEYKAKLAAQMWGTDRVSMDEKGAIYKDGLKVDPTNQSWVDFIKDAPGEIAEGITNLLPVWGQIGADLLITAAAAPSGGASLGALSLANAGGAAAGEMVKQKLAYDLIQEPPSGVDLAMETAFGAVTPAIGLGIDKGLQKIGVKALAKPVEHLGKTFDEKNLPNILKTVMGLEEGQGEKLVQLMKKGTDLKTVFTDDMAKPSIPSEIYRKQFFGANDAPETIENFFKSYRKQLVDQPQNAVNLIDDVYSKNFGLSQQTLDIMKKSEPQQMLNNLYTSQDHRKVAENVLNQINQGKQGVVKNLDSALKKFSNSPESKEIIDLTPYFKELTTDMKAAYILDDGGAKIETAEAANKIYDKIKTAFGGNVGDLQRTSPTGLTRGEWDALTSKMSEKGGLSVDGKKVGQWEAMKLYKKTQELGNLIDEDFHKLKPNQQVPLTKFLKNVRGAIAEKSRELKAANAQMERYYNLKDAFGYLRVGAVDSEIAMANTLGKAYGDGTLKSYIADFDRKFGTNVVRAIDRLGAASELKGLELTKTLDTARDKFIGLLRKVNSITDKNEVELMRLSSFSQVSKTPFLELAQQHSLVSAWAELPQSFFKTKYLAFLAGSMIGMPHVGIPLFAATYAATKPANVLKMLSTKQTAGKTIKEGTKKTFEAVGKTTNSSAGRAAIAGLLRGNKK